MFQDSEFYKQDGILGELYLENNNNNNNNNELQKKNDFITHVGSAMLHYKFDV